MFCLTVIAGATSFYESAKKQSGVQRWLEVHGTLFDLWFI